MTESSTHSQGATCRVCGSTRHQEKWNVLRECLDCHFIFFGDATPEELAKLYDRDYFHGEEYTDYLGQEFALRKSMRRHLDQMQRFQPLEGPLLEVGCAYGFFLDEARHRVDSVRGIDVAEDAVQYANKTFGLETHYGDFLTYDFGEQRFRTICLWDTIEHLAQPDRFMRRAFELLQPGGMIYVTTGDISAFNARIRGRHWRQIHPPTHVSYFSRDTMKRLLENCGFDVLPIETATYFHTVKHILGALAMRPGLAGKIAKPLEASIGESIGKWGFWLNLGDTMFAAARRPQD